MAVPKKRTSKSKKNIRKNAWKKKVLKQASKSLFLAKHLLKNKPKDSSVEKVMTQINSNSENLAESSNKNSED
uniref:Large ribosomal subunit protein bL32c n=1 Tax=Treubaria triappendiculata TaxID=1755147 RepID=A0A0S2LMQ2_TRETR|nr:ribosomal protein L32 [Treubaria triappendiculata]ALO62689.1 ribosomal protein L32 [Treubaria triappendiculata]